MSTAKRIARRCACGNKFGRLFIFTHIRPYSCGSRSMSGSPNTTNRLSLLGFLRSSAMQICVHARLEHQQATELAELSGVAS